MIDQAFVMLDFETTGSTPEQGDRITEVAALRVAGGVVVERFVSLVNTGARIPPFIERLTGISQAMVDRAPPVAEIVPALLDFIGGDALAAHNAGFDERFLIAESARLTLAPAHARLLCSLKLARRVLPGQASYSLGALAGDLGIVFSGPAHRAEADAEAAAALLLRIGERLRGHYGYPAVDLDALESLAAMPAAKARTHLQRRLAPQPV